MSWPTESNHILHNMNRRSIVTKVVRVDDDYVTIGIVETRPGFTKPFCASVSIEHNGNPEGVAEGYHEFIREMQKFALSSD